MDTVPLNLPNRTDQTASALAPYFDASPVATFAIDADHAITHWNKACERTTGSAAADMIGTCDQWRPFYDTARPTLADLIVSGSTEEVIRTHYGKYRRSPLIAGAYEVEHFFPHLGAQGRWLFFSAAPLFDADGNVAGAVETLQDVTKRKEAEENLRSTQLELESLVSKRTDQLAQANRRLEEDICKREETEAELLRRNADLTELNAKLTVAQEQLMQSDKLASIGQLAAGVAHEINNPIGYIFSNFGTLENYLADLFDMLAIYEKAEQAIAAPEVRADIAAAKERLELAYLKEDIPVLMSESKEGIARVRKIVQDLKDFSRVDTHQEWQWTNLHRGIDSTLNIVANEIKYKADVVKRYGDIPEVECLPSEINQVIMNVAVNAAHSMSETRGTITVTTGADAEHAWIEIADTGSGIPKENLSRIFDPFFTTKPVGKGTGLGLSLAYGIVQKHRGHIDVESEPGKGTTFRIVLPIRHPEEDDQRPQGDRNMQP
jgi:two-component system, NtrC family, sensor kinase